MEENDQVNQQENTASVALDDEISLLDIAIILAKYKQLVFGFPLVVAIITAIVTLLMPNVYIGRVVLMPPQQQQSIAATMLGQLGALSASAGGALGIKNPTDLYAGIIKSRTVMDALIAQFNLQELYDEETLVETREELDDVFSVLVGKDDLIVIEIEDKDPQRAADMANAVIEQLKKLTSTLAITESSQRRKFFEEQLARAHKDLAAAELALKEIQEGTGLVQIDEQGRAIIEAVATLRAQIVAKEVQLSTVRLYATDQNPQLQSLRDEIVSLKAELRKLERGSRESESALLATKDMPAASLEYARKYRDLKYAESIMELLAKQFEMARIDEARDAAIIQVVDHAIVPDKKSKPRRALIVAMVFVLSVVIAIVVAFVLESRRDAKYSRKWLLLARHSRRDA